ncbi:MAG: glycosyltransferase family 2 protein [Chthoniobacterales bacterium]
MSVIIPTYNYSSVLRYAVATVLWQTFADFELIVVGDCCTDDSEAVVRSFNDPRVLWMNLPENSGAKYIPQNAAVAVARGRYIAYLGHDDLWHPSHLETVLGAIRSADADVAYSVLIYVPPPGETRRDVSGIFPEGEFRPSYVLNHSTVVHRKELIREVGPWEDHRTSRLPPDHIFFSRIAEAGKRFVAVPKLTVWKFNASSRPGSYQHKRSDEQARYFELIRDDPGLAERELIDLARSAMIHGLEPLRMMKVARDSPPGAYIHFLRQVRGLEPTEEMERLPLAADEKPFQIDLATPAPTHACVGEKIELEVRVENETSFRLSSEKPFPVHLSYHWLKADGSCAVWDGVRSRFLPPLKPRATLHYIMRVDAPKEPGCYSLQLAVVQENARWYKNAATGELPAVDVQPRQQSGEERLRTKA